MKTTLTIALLLLSLIVIVGFVAACVVAPYWLLPIYIIGGWTFGSTVGEWLEAIWRVQ